MKLLLIIILMIGGALGANSAQTDTEIEVTEGMEIIQPLVSEAPPLAAAATSIEGESLAEPIPNADTSSGCKDQPISILNSVGGVSLYDTPESVISKLGEPDKIEQDEIWSELEIYYYPSVRVAFYSEQVHYVDVPAAEQIIINDKSVPMTEDGLKACLGQPDFIAEDGIVFQRSEAVLKLFFDESTGEPLYASFYHIATV
jgi:hypothetical protein